MKITKAEAQAITKGLVIEPERMNAVITFCAKDGKDAMSLGRYGIYLALGDLLQQPEDTHFPIQGSGADADGMVDLTEFKDSITPEVAFATLSKYTRDSRRVVTLLNTSIVTSEGTHSLKKVSLEEACKLVCGATINSAIGHEATAKIMDSLLGIEVPVNRQAYKSKVGDVALVFKLNGRPPEGKILSIQEMEEIGYEFFILTHLA